MIENRLQYVITKQQISKFNKALDEFNFMVRLSKGIDKMLVIAEYEALVSMRDDLQAQITEWLKKDHFDF